MFLGEKKGGTEEGENRKRLILRMRRRQKSKKMSGDMGETPGMTKKTTAFSLIKTLFQQILTRLIKISK